MDALQKHLKKIASSGGKATYDKYGKEHYQALSKKGNKAKKKLKGKK